MAEASAQVASRASGSTSASKRNAGDTQANIAAIGDELQVRALAFERAHDARCVFARAYSRLSHQLAASMPNAGFDDPEWIAELARVFVSYYLRALDQHDAGTLPPGAWATVFRATEQRRTSVLEDLVLGMTAHIVNDLPQALGDVGMRAPDGTSRLADYDRVNEVLGRAIEPIEADLSRLYDPLLAVIDQLLEHYDEILTNYGIRIARAAAWYNAERLLDPASRAAALAAIGESPDVTIREILNPPVWSLRFALRAARIVARSARRWPEAASPT